MGDMSVEEWGVVQPVLYCQRGIAREEIGTYIFRKELLDVHRRKTFLQ